MTSVEQPKCNLSPDNFTPTFADKPHASRAGGLVAAHGAATVRWRKLRALVLILAFAALDALPAHAGTSYVRTCDTFGSGFFIVPGSSDTCIQIGGYLRADTTFTTPRAEVMPGFNLPVAVAPGLSGAGARDADYFTSRFALSLDLRTLTSYGTLRAYGLGDFDAGTAGVTGLERGFIQFAGLTAGRAESFFDFYAYGADMLGLRDSYAPTNMLAYTAILPMGMSTSLGLEDPSTRTLAPLALSGIGASATTAGARWPDLVANLRFDGEGLTVQTSAALHQTRISVSDAGGLYQASSLGFAGQIGARFDLSGLTIGDALWVESAYADGALSYLGFGNAGPNAALFSGVGLARPDVDVVVTDATGGALTLERQRGWTMLAAYSHFWQADLRQSLLVGYGVLLPGRATRVASWSSGGLGRWQELRAGSELEWTPVDGLSLALEGEVQRVQQRLAGPGPAATPPLPYGVAKDYTALVGRLRVQRAF